MLKERRQKMFKYKCLNPIAKIGLDGFSDQYQKVEETDASEIILVRSAKMHEMQFDKELVAIARAGAGVNNIPLDRCAEDGIVVFNTPGANANGVKELVLFSLIASVRDIIGGIGWVKSEAGNEDIAALAEKEKKKFVGNEIFGKTIAVVGLGAIGVKVANACVGLGMKVKGYDAFLSEAAKANLDPQVEIGSSNEDIIKDADFITLHIPALDSTKGMVNKDFIAQMKDGVVIVNAARDTLVNEADMTEALESGKVRKYVCDFPTKGNNAMPNAIIIPHLGASTEESEDNCAIMAVAEISDFMENGNIRNSVNYPAVSLGEKKAARIAICHKAQVEAKAFCDIIKAKAGVKEMETAARGEFAYSLFELEGEANDELLAELNAIEGALKIRAL